MALAEVISLVKIGGAIVGSSVATLLLAKWFGKKKEEIDIALNYQEYYGKLIEDINKANKARIEEIERKFGDKIEKLIKQVNTLANSKEMYEEEKQKFVQESYEKDLKIEGLEKQLEARL